MYLPEPRSSLIAGIVILLLSCAIIDANSEETKAPICPIVYGDGCGGFEIYWFYPGENKLSVGNNTIISERGVIPSMNDRQYCILTTINLTPPYYIESTNTFIRNNDKYSDLPGDQFTPIRLAVKEKISDNYYEDLWYEYVNLKPEADLAGAVVEGVTNLGIDNLFDIYLALEWLPGTPTAPMVGVNSLPPYYYQTFCPMDDSSFQTVYAVPCAMVGAEILSWHTTNTMGIDTSKYDNLMNYEILYSDDSTDIFSDGEIIASISSDSLTANFNLTQSGYIMVKAINTGIEGGASSSKSVFIDKDKLPPVLIQPQSLFLNSMNKSDNDKIVLENSGENNLKLSINYDTSLFVLSDNSIFLEKETSLEITVEIKDGIDLPGQISSPIIVRTAGDYYSQIMHVTILGSNSTSVDDNELPLPDKFGVSQAYPNPFNSTVRFNLVQTNQMPVQMDVYNLLGQKVYFQVFKPSQRRSVRWDGIDNLGNKTGSGIYFVKFSTDEAVILRKVLMLK